MAHEAGDDREQTTGRRRGKESCSRTTSPLLEQIANPGSLTCVQADDGTLFRWHTPLWAPPPSGPLQATGGGPLSWTCRARRTAPGAWIAISRAGTWGGGSRSAIQQLERGSETRPTPAAPAQGTGVTISAQLANQQGREPIAAGPVANAIRPLAVHGQTPKEGPAPLIGATTRPPNETSDRRRGLPRVRTAGIRRTRGTDARWLPSVRLGVPVSQCPSVSAPSTGNAACDGACPLASPSPSSSLASLTPCQAPVKKTGGREPLKSHRLADRSFPLPRPPSPPYSAPSSSWPRLDRHSPPRLCCAPVSWSRGFNGRVSFFFLVPRPRPSATVTLSSVTPGARDRPSRTSPHPLPWH